MNRENKSRGYLKLTKEYLYIANDGNKFDRKGVIALCMPHLSDKSDEIHTSNFDDFCNEEFIEKYNEARMSDYERDPNRITSDGKDQEAIIKDYSGRWIFELLQNIDDAIGEKDKRKYIGTKGVGFLSVLEVGKKPCIYSGGFDFTFDKDKTAKELSEMGIEQRFIKKVGSFQVPWPSSRDEVTREIFDEGFSTVMRFEINDGRYEMVKDELENLDHKFLVFSQNLNAIKIDIEKKQKTYTRKIINIKKGIKSIKDEIIIEINGGESINETWIRWQNEWDSPDKDKKSSCMFALPLKDGECKPLGSTQNVYNFFQTDEDSKIKGLLHVTFMLSQNRKELQMHGDIVPWNHKSIDQENISLIDAARELLLEDVIFDDLVPCSTALNVFSDCLCDKKGNRLTPIQKIQDEIRSKIFEVEFLPTVQGRMSSMQYAQLWKNSLIDLLHINEKLDDYCLLSKSIEEEFPLIEKNYERNKSHYLDEEKIFRILANCDIKNEAEEDRKKITEIIINNDTYSGRDIVLDIPFIEVDDGEVKKLSDGFFALSKIKDIPYGKLLNVSTASKKDLKLIKTRTYWVYRGISKKLIENKYDYIRLILEELCDKEEEFWRESGEKIIAFLYKCYSENDASFKDAIDSIEVKLPIVKGKDTWSPSKDIYFSESWKPNGNLKNWLEKTNANLNTVRSLNYFKNILNNQLDEKVKNKYKLPQIKAFLKALDVMEVPKIREVCRNDLNKEYVKIMSNQGLTKRNKDYGYPNLNTYFKGVQIEKSIASVTELLERDSKYCAQWGHSKTRTSWKTPNSYHNYGAYQLKSTKWIFLPPSPINASGSFSPNECYFDENVPGHNVFPAITRNRFNSKIIQKLKTLGVADKRSKKYSVWNAWASSIPSTYEALIEKSDIKIIHSQIEMFYKVFIDNYSDIENAEGIIVNNKLPVKKSDDNFGFSHYASVIWNDLDFSEDKILGLVNHFKYSLFILDESQSKLLRKTSIPSLSNEFNLEVKEKLVGTSVNDKTISFIEKKWDIMIGIDLNCGAKNSKKNKKQLIDELCLCEYIDIQFTEKYDQLNESKSYEIKDIDIYKCENRVYIKYDEMNENLIKYICNDFFMWNQKTTITKNLLKAESEKEFYQIVDDEKMDKKLFEQVEFYQHDYSYDPSPLDSQTSPEKNTNNPSRTKSPISKLPQQESKISKKDSPESAIADKSQTSRVTRSKSGSRKSRKHSSLKNIKSGIIRPANQQKDSGRKCFDDESETNKNIGDKAEVIVSNLLRENKTEVELLGGNNKGFDIQCKDGKNTLFIEVKGINGFWSDYDVTFSSSQFEKAQKEGDNFYLYVVENVLDNDNYKVYSIQNPASYFTKMHLDSGWSTFSVTPLTTPKKGMYVLIESNKYLIEDVVHRGSLTRLTLEDGTVKTYNPSSMSLENA